MPVGSRDSTVDSVADAVVADAVTADDSVMDADAVVAAGLQAKCFFLFPASVGTARSEKVPDTLRKKYLR